MYTYQDLRPWNLCIQYIYIYTRTYVLGIYTYLPGPMSLQFMYLPGLMSLDSMFIYQDFCPCDLCILTMTCGLGCFVHIYIYVYIYICIYQDLCIDIYLYIDIYLWYLITIIWYFNTWQHIHMYTLRTTKAPLRTLHTTKKQ